MLFRSAYVSMQLVGLFCWKVSVFEHDKGGVGNSWVESPPSFCESGPGRSRVGNRKGRVGNGNGRVGTHNTRVGNQTTQESEPRKQSSRQPQKESSRKRGEQSRKREGSSRKPPNTMSRKQPSPNLEEACSCLQSELWLIGEKIWRSICNVGVSFALALCYQSIMFSMTKKFNISFDENTNW